MTSPPGRPPLQPVAPTPVPVSTGRVQKKQRTPFVEKMKVQWCYSKSRLSADAVEMSSFNSAKRARDDDAQSGQAAGSPPSGGADAAQAQENAAKRPHRATTSSFKHLPAGFKIGVARIGAVRVEPGAKEGVRPLRDVVYPPMADGGVGETRVYDSLTGINLPSGEKCNRPSKTWTVSQHMAAQEYSRDFGYTKDGKDDVNAVVNDALARRLVSICTLYTLAAAYEKTIAAKDATIARLERQLAGRMPAARAPRAPSRTTGPSAPGKRAAPAATPADAADRPPAKKSGRKPKADPKGGVDAAAEAATKRRGQRLRQRIYGFMAMASGLLGGPAGFTLFFVMMLKSGVCKTGLAKRFIFLSKDVVRLMVDDEQLCKALTKEIDSRRRPKMAQFRNAQFSGVSISAIDKLRFASIWTPGHGTMAKAAKEWEAVVAANYCPSGPDPWAWQTTRTTAEQQATGGAPAVDEDDDEEDEEDETLEREAAAAGNDDSAADAGDQLAASVEKQALDLLRAEFPDAEEAELLDKWAGGADEVGVLRGANPVQLVAIRDGVVLGLLKLLVTDYEIYVDEALTAEAGRRQGIMTHLFAEAARMFPDSPRFRLQVIKGLAAQSLYELLSFLLWKAPGKKSRAVKDKAFKGITPDDSTRMFMHAEVDEVLQRATSLLAAKPDRKVLNGRIWKQAQFSVSGLKLDRISSEPEGGAEPAEAATEPAEPASAAPAATNIPPPPADGRQRRQPDAHVELDDDEEQMRNPAPAKKAASKGWGCSVANAYQVQSIALTGSSIILPKSAAQRNGNKITCDKANLMNAPKGWKGVTSVLLQRLCDNVRPGVPWGSAAVRYMAVGAQSCKRAMCTNLWFGDDGAANFEANVVPQMEEALQLEDGVDCDIPQELPPWSLERDENGKRRVEVDRPIYDLPATKKNAGKETGRAVLATAVRMLPCFMFCFDAGTSTAASGACLQSTKPDMFTDELGDNLGHFHEVCVLKRGETLTDLAERLIPGCSRPGDRNQWLIKYLCALNSHAYHSELQAVTREPKRRDPPAMGVGKNATAAAKAVAKLMNDANAGDGRTVTLMPYVDADLRRLRYDHKNGQPGIDGGLDGAATRKARQDCWVRVPVQPEHYKRELPTAAWGKPRPGQPLPAPAHDLLLRFGLCIMHCAMRTAESCLTQMLHIASNKYLNNKKKDQDAVKEHLNDYLWDRLRLRRLITVNEKGELNKIQVNGEEVKILYADLLSGDSEVLKAVKNLYKALDVNGEVSKVSRWERVLMHWARAMRAAFVMHASAADRQTFREEVKFYIMEKSSIRSGITTWYDWQLYSIFTDIFDDWGSLRLICQEGMEGFQKRLNMFMRLCNNFSNAGRIPWAVKVAGQAARLAYLKVRAGMKKLPEQWLWMRVLAAYFAEYNPVFELVEMLKKTGRVVDWASSLVPSWFTYIVTAKLRCRYRAWQRLRSSSKLGAAAQRTARWMRRDDGLNPRDRPWLMGVRKLVDVASPNFSVPVKTVYGEGLAEELEAYYAPVACEDKFPEDIDGETARRLIQRERRKRWKARERKEWWMPHAKKA